MFCVYSAVLAHTCQNMANKIKNLVYNASILRLVREDLAHILSTNASYNYTNMLV